MANLKDLIVNGASQFIGKIYGTVTKADIAEKALKDGSGNVITTSYKKKYTEYKNQGTVNLASNTENKVVAEASVESNVYLPTTMAVGDEIKVLAVVFGVRDYMGSVNIYKGSTLIVQFLNYAGYSDSYAALFDFVWDGTNLKYRYETFYS